VGCKPHTSWGRCLREFRAKERQRRQEGSARGRRQKKKKKTSSRYAQKTKTTKANTGAAGGEARKRTPNSRRKKRQGNGRAKLTKERAPGGKGGHQARHAGGGCGCEGGKTAYRGVVGGRLVLGEKKPQLTGAKRPRKIGGKEGGNPGFIKNPPKTNPGTGPGGGGVKLLFFPEPPSSAQTLRRGKTDKPTKEPQTLHGGKLPFLNPAGGDWVNRNVNPGGKPGGGWQKGWSTGPATAKQERPDRGVFFWGGLGLTKTFHGWGWIGGGSAPKRNSRN